MRRWNLSIGTLLLILGLAGLVAFVVFASVFASRAALWTGFAADPLPPGASATPVVVYEQGKDLWDWLQLLLVPLVLAIGGFLLTRTENRYALELQERREKEAQRLEDHRAEEAQKLEDQRIAETRRIEEERAQDAALQAYLDQMTDLLLHENLLASQVVDVVRTVARARTITVLKQLNDARKAQVIRFLYEAALLGMSPYEKSDSDEVGETEKYVGVVNLTGLDLKGVQLREIWMIGPSFQEVDLEGANLERAFLPGAHFYGTNLSDANLQLTILSKADLRSANLRRANLHKSQLEAADLRHADLGWTDLRGADLRMADLQKAYLQAADLRWANLQGADLRGTELRWAKLQGANLQGANFNGANITDAFLDDTILDGAIGLPEQLKPKP